MYCGFGNAVFSGGRTYRGIMVDGIVGDRKDAIFHILLHKHDSDEFDTVYACKACPMIKRRKNRHRKRHRSDG